MSYNQNGKWWTQEDEGHYSGYAAGMGSVGPFTFHPGDIQEIDMAYVFANSYYNADSSKNLLIDRLSKLRQQVLDGEILISNNELSIDDKSSNQIELKIYPNPARELIYIKSNSMVSGQYKISNVLGHMVRRGEIRKQQNVLVNINGLAKGIYLMSIQTNKGNLTQKFVKL